MDNPTRVFDPIMLEVLRYRLEAICAAGGRAIERTAISPIVAETKDYSCTLTSAEGVLVQGGGAVRHHFATICNAVQATLERHAGTIAAGDTFLVNDPHNGGGLHAQDTIILQPVFHGETLAAWIGCSAHMSDMGGMVFGSWAPNATDCYQEAIRFPPVRIADRGVEQRDIWDILRNNVRIPDIVEMDMRALVAGAHVAVADLAKLIESMGVDAYVSGTKELCRRVEEEVRRRIASLTDGEYSCQTWLEWREETFSVPCTLTIKGDRLKFDFEGASPQTSHFFNSHRFIVLSELATELSSFLAHDLPYNGGFIDTLELHCPQGSILDSAPPAPIAAGHMEVAMTATEIAIQSYMLALAASPESPLARFATAAPISSCYLFQTWGGENHKGQMVGWLTIEGASNGGAGSPHRDGNDLGIMSVGQRHGVECPDVEVMEDWYPVRYDYKRPRISALGSGRSRAGGSLEAAYRRVGTAPLIGTNLGNRQTIPFPGLAGGMPGMTSTSHIRRSDGSIDALDNHDQGFTLEDGDVLEVCPGSGGGWGDPLDRDPELIEADIADGRLDEANAQRIYAIVAGDRIATAELRRAARSDRLARAEPARTRVTGVTAVDEADLRGPLYFGIEQYGDLAVSKDSGAILARAPDHWTSGCPIIDDLVPAADGIRIRAYLDPVDGRILATDVVVGNVERSFNSAPARWIEAAVPAQVTTLEEAS